MAKTKEELKKVTNTGANDTSSIASVPDLAKKYLFPIDNFRSITLPTQANPAKPGEEYKNLYKDGNRPIETRAHAFYRMIGFPVATSSGFYNPGFNPLGHPNPDKVKNVDTDFFSSPMLSATFNRQVMVRGMKSIFERQDLASALYAIVLMTPRPFQVLDDGKGPFDEDKQTGTVDSRREDVDYFKLYNEDLILEIEELSSFFSIYPPGANLDTWNHVLRPFVCDPWICRVAQPNSIQIAAPFMEKVKEATAIEPNVYVSRPFIEQVIVESFRSAEITDTKFLDELTGVLKPVDGSSLASLDVTVLQDTIIALADDNNLEISESEIKEMFGEYTSLQVVRVSELVKIIKYVVGELHEAMLEVDKQRMQINWVPMPHPEGPEMGVYGARLYNTGTSNSAEIDQKIAALDAKEMLADRDRTKEQGDNEFVGSYASPFQYNPGGTDTKKIKNERKALADKRNQIGHGAFNAMGTIEIIMGEVSGLGLIDVLAIYAALWSMEQKYLLGLLDDDAFYRLLAFNPDLINATVEERAAGTTQEITTVLEHFEKKLINILSFADKELAKRLADAVDQEGSD